MTLNVGAEVPPEYHLSHHDDDDKEDNDNDDEYGDDQYEYILM